MPSPLVAPVRPHHALDHYSDIECQVKPALRKLERREMLFDDRGYRKNRNLPIGPASHLPPLPTLG